MTVACCCKYAKQIIYNGMKQKRSFLLNNLVKIDSIFLLENAQPVLFISHTS